MLSENVPTPSDDDMASPEPVRPVLIVDDELAIIDMLREVLREEGYAVVAANNGTAALHLLQRTLVLFILTDFR